MPTNAPAQPEHYDIFISYRTTRRPWVETLAHNLTAQG
ncbi:toll/interleukin-1 receptor domain-containing protein [Leucothrix pacifica]|nr:toll/interleukin-1 receptor domain-containing protein [Leucothrix pacifica]